MRVARSLSSFLIYLEEQERVVAVLDKFHSICEDIEEGIPKLIEDVTKQYEYYRDQIFD